MPACAAVDDEIALTPAGQYSTGTATVRIDLGTSAQQYDVIETRCEPHRERERERDHPVRCYRASLERVLGCGTSRLDEASTPRPGLNSCMVDLDLHVEKVKYDRHARSTVTRPSQVSKLILNLKSSIADVLGFEI